MRKFRLQNEKSLTPERRDNQRKIRWRREQRRLQDTRRIVSRASMPPFIITILSRQLNDNCYDAAAPSPRPVLQTFAIIRKEISWHPSLNVVCALTPFECAIWSLIINGLYLLHGPRSGRERRPVKQAKRFASDIPKRKDQIPLIMVCWRPAIMSYNGILLCPYLCIFRSTPTYRNSRVFGCNMYIAHVP